MSDVWCVLRVGDSTGSLPPLDRGTTISYEHRLSVVKMSLFAAVWQQFWAQRLPPSPTCAELAYPILALIVAFDSSGRHHRWYGTAVTLRNRFRSATGNQTMAFGHRGYGRPFLTTAGLYVIMGRYALITLGLAVVTPTCEKCLCISYFMRYCYRWMYTVGLIDCIGVFNSTMTRYVQPASMSYRIIHAGC